MLHSAYGSASNFGNENAGIIAGENVKITVNPPRLSSTDIPQTTRSHAHSTSVYKRLLLRGSIGRTRSSWDDWDLDEVFFRSLSQYIVEHPEGRLDCIMDRIAGAMEGDQDYLALIPDNPFPAESLFKALGCLLKLGTTVKRMKQDVFKFARQVVEWVESVRSAFEDPERNRFTFLTWRSLRNTRDLIDEICSWAQYQLEDFRWTQARNGFRIRKEIDEFKGFLADSKAIFKDVSLLHLGGGTSAILSGLWSILFRQDQILNEIRKIKKQQQDQLEYIINEDEEMKKAQVRRVFLEKKLDRHTVFEPNFAAQGKIPCDEGTREAELTQIMIWLNSISPGSQNFLWLTGDAGCGKSAITATLAAHCRIEGVLWAQFFINRNNEKTTNPNMFFPTIARQLADFSPDVERAIHDQLKVDPTLSDCMTSAQATKIFINALAVASKLDPGKVVAVIIDGLDETDRSRLYDTADIFSHLFKSLTRYPNVKVFVSSRTEDDIRKPFARYLENTNVEHIHLDTNSSIGDVAMFMRRHVEGIVERYELIWEEWPTEKGMELLSIRASGLFIWAVTAVKYLRAKIDEDGQECLGVVLEQLTGKALEGINNLYMFILLSTQTKLSTDLKREFENFQRVIGIILVLREPLCLDDISALLNVRYGPDNVPAGILHFVRRLRTVLVAGADVIDGKTIPRLHKSFCEFITDATLFEQLSMDHRFCVDLAVAEVEMAMCCIRLFSHSRKGKGRIPLQEGLHLEYASRFYLSHLDAVARKASMSAVALMVFDATVEDVYNQFSTVRQTGCLTPWFPIDLDGSPPAPFSPLTAAYQVTGGRRVLAATKSIVATLAYSPDGEKIASGFNDGRLILWNVKEGIEIAELKGHNDLVASVAFSSLGDQIASGSKDKIIRIWNVTTTQLMSTLREHSDEVLSVTFSPVENVVASGSRDRSIRLWSTYSGESIGFPFHHGHEVNSVTFSTYGTQLISGASDGLIYIWDRNTGECRQKLKSIISKVHSVALSPLGDRLAAIGDGGFCFWNRSNLGFVLDDRLTLNIGSDASHSRVAFSRDRKSVIVSNCSFDSCQKFFAYDLSTRTKISIHDDDVIGDFALAPDGSSVMFAVDENIYTSDVPQLLSVTFASLSPDAEIVACAFLGGSVWLASPKNLPVVNKQLEGKVCNVKHLTFSSDNRLIAAVDDNFIYLWHVSTRNICGHASSKSLGRITSLSFLANRCTVITSHEDQSMYAWDVVDGALCPRQIDFSSSDFAFDPQLLLDVDQSQAYEIAGARWFPAKSKDSGLWAYIDGTLIRTRRDGTVTLLPLNST